MCGRDLDSTPTIHERMSRRVVAVMRDLSDITNERPDHRLEAAISTLDGVLADTEVVRSRD